ncbi:hypothetical protein KST17_01920 [Fusobacterium canifelinum]|uniref:hypothetical protein n=1 Tax=Fusobacterium canifelinum TaxID=285729 RepID=UPI0030D363A4
MQWERHKKAKEEIKNIFNQLINYRIIHYPCQSFSHVENGKTAIVTSIAVYSFSSDTTTSFDIQSSAEQLGIEYDNISISDNPKKIEEKLLRDFFEYINTNKNCKYLHWNMRDSQYGFQALVNRFKVLTGEEPEYTIPDIQQKNIAKLLEDYYGTNYVKDPKIKSLIKINSSIKPQFILFGDEEANAFDKGKYNDLHKSTLAKVRLFEKILNSVNDNKLKVSISFLKSFGASPQALFEKVSSKWWWSFITFFLGILIGNVLNKFLQN